MKTETHLFVTFLAKTRMKTGHVSKNCGLGWVLPQSIISVRLSLGLAVLLISIGNALNAKEEPRQDAVGKASRQESSPANTTLSERLQKVLAQSDEAARREQLQTLGAELGLKQPAEGLVLRTLIRKASDQQAFLAMVMRNWSLSQPQAALAAAKQLPSGLLRRTASAAAVEGWAMTSPAVALDWASKNLAGSSRREAMARAASAWAQNSPQKAAQWASKLSSTNLSESAIVIEEVMREWALRDPKAATAWCETLAAGDFSDQAHSALFFTWAEISPAAAAEWLTQNAGHEWLIPRVAAIWAAVAPVDAANWIYDIHHEQGLSPIMLSWADDAPEEALGWCKANLAGDQYAELRDEILQTWGADEGEAAARWVQKLSSPQEALQAGSIAMEAWLGDSKTPLPQISAWLTAQKSGPVKDIGLEKLAVALEPTFPVQATIAALKIQDRQRMQDTLTKVWLAWKERDPFGARTWLNSHPEAQRFIDK